MSPVPPSEQVTYSSHCSKFLWRRKTRRQRWHRWVLGTCTCVWLEYNNHWSKTEGSDCNSNKSINSLSPGRFQFNFRKVNFKLTLVNGGIGVSYEIVLRWMPQYFTDDKSTLVQVMAWCRQATSHYLSQYRPKSMSPNGVTRPQWVNHHKEQCQSEVPAMIF